MKIKEIILVAVIVGILSSLITVTSLNYLEKDNLIKDFYLTETSVHVSPHHIRKAMDKGDSNFILVDLRSDEEYEREHIVGAINIPAYRDPYTSAYGDVERIVGEFSKLPKDKEIIVYCYSTPCMTGRKVGGMLAENGIFVKHLGVGWNEWRYFWTMWNHEHEWNITNVEDYVVKGKNPGVPKLQDYGGCSIEGKFGC
ncbi:MAG: hypothetical protein CMH62_01020 [Nanoarchaeota archaeon]|nr:hypothetical protein [Nanoarchaeota archaeon]